MANQKITIETLARMINEGFKTTATKEDIQRVEERLDGIDSRLDRIEHLLLAEQKREIEDLKNRMKRLEDALAV
jgi:archaellum component FlaC